MLTRDLFAVANLLVLSAKAVVTTTTRLRLDARSTSLSLFVKGH